MPDNRELTDPYIRGLKASDKRQEIYDTKIKALAIRIGRSGQKSFVYRYRFGKKVRRFTIGRYPKIKLASARKAVTELENMLRNGIDPLEEKRRKKNTPTPLTVTEICDIYVEKHLPNLKQTTRDDYKRRIEIIKKGLGDIPAKDLSRTEIIDFLEDILEEDAPIQSNRLRAILSSIYTFGVNRGHVEFNPVKTVKPLAPENQRNRIYTDDEIKVLWQNFQMEQEPFRTILKMLLICGQRAGETRLAKWEDISDDYTWTIPAENTKANREQVLPLPDLAQKLLNELKNEAETSGYIFASPREIGQPIQWLQNSAKRVREMKTCTVSDFRLHDLRRTVASNLAKLGINRTVIGKTLNHKGIAGDSMVTAVYDRYEYLEEKKIALQLWSDHLKRLIYDDQNY